MKNTLVILSILIGFTAYAATESKPLELPSFKENEAVSKKGGNFEMTCKTGGRTVKSGEPGYESCVTEAQSDVTNRMNRDGKTTGSAGGQDSNFNIQFGN
jgi:hypothetical protein